jgi:hypothetical protein
VFLGGVMRALAGRQYQLAQCLPRPPLAHNSLLVAEFYAQLHHWSWVWETNELFLLAPNQGDIYFYPLAKVGFAKRLSPELKRRFACVWVHT